jgi:uncharacterized protein YaeQ
MALTATVRKIELNISDIDRGYYANHHLTYAQHPSETDERLMVRVIAFALFADERLLAGRGLSSEDEPDLWKHDYTGEIDTWLDLGQPDPVRVRKACGRSAHVIVVPYGGQSAEHWWDKNASALQRFDNLTVVSLPVETVEALGQRIARSMRFELIVQDGELQLIGEGLDEGLTIIPQWRKREK